VIVANWTGRQLAKLVRMSARWPWTTVLVSIVLAVGASVYTSRTLEFVTSPLRLLPQDAPYVVHMKQHLRDFGELNDIVVAVEAGDPEVGRRYAARLVETLQRDRFEARVTYRVDPGFFDRRGLLYLSVEDLTRLRDRLFDYEEFIAEYAERPTLVRLLEGLNQQFANAMALGFLDLGLGSRGESDLRFLDVVVTEIAARLEGPSPYVSPWATGFSMGRFDDPDAGYFMSSDKHLLFLFVEQRRDEGDFASNRARIDTLRRTVAALSPEFPGVRAGVTGGPAIANDEMATAFQDTALSTVIATVLTLALLLGAFRRVGAPALMLGTLTVSLVWATGLIALTVGHLSVFSIMFISLVIGIGIDYGIYVLFRSDEERALGALLPAALERTAERTGPGILFGALTAAGAFLVLTLTDFRGIREFGIVSAIAILAAFVSMVTLFPALLILDERRRAGRPGGIATRAPVKSEEAVWLVRATRWQKTILVAAAALTALGAWGALDVAFDYNMLHLQAAGVESVVWEERILARAGRSGFTALSTVATLPELSTRQAAFTGLDSVSKVESALMLVPDHQPEKIGLVRQFAPLIASVRPTVPPALEAVGLRAPLEVLRRRLGLAAEGTSDERLRADVLQLRAKVETVLAKLGAADAGRLQQLQTELYQDFADKLGRFQKSLDPQPVRPGELPPELHDRYVGKSGRYLLRIHPAVDIWTAEGARRFVAELRAVDPDVTGPPVTSFEAIRFIERGYLEGTVYAIVLVTIITAAILRSLRGTLLALTPVALGVLWTVGVMRLAGLEFNLANVWAVPLILGTAAEYGLNLFLRFLEGLERGEPWLVRSLVLAVVLNGFTTVAGFGSLMVAHHHGIFTLGLLLSVGATAALLAALFVLPVLIERFGPVARTREPA
jgi:hopanoid biosynthesis associated RND transporter like protein HpnN